MKALIKALFIALLLVAFTCSAASADHTGGMWGTCPWALDDAGTLTIGTEGARTTGADTGEDGDRIPWKNVKDSIREVAFLGEVRLPADSGYLFSSCHSLRKIDFGKIDTSNVTNLCGMFWGCHFLRGDTLAAAGIGGWDVSGVTDMSYLFCGCEISFDSSSDSYGGCLDLNGWDTAQVTNMSGMFSSAFWRLEEIRFDGWDTSNVTDMSGLFREAFSSRLAVLDLGGWNTSSAVNMESMFLETYARKVTLGNAFSFCGAKSEPQTQLAEEIWETGGSWMSEKTGVCHTSANIASSRNNLYDTYTFSPYLTWDDLSFHFGNLDEYHLSDYTIPFELYEVFMPYGKAVAHYSLDKGRWNGSCAGFAAAAVLLNDTQKMLSPSEFCANAVAAISPLSKSDAFSINKRSIQTLAGIGLSEVTVTRRMTLTDLIDSLYLGQFRFKREYKDNLDLIVKEVIAGKIRHELPILSIRHGATSSTLTSSGHVLVPYDVVEEGNEARMYVYDCNFPGYYEYCRSGMIDEDDARAHFLEYDRNRYIRLEKSADGKYTKWYYHTNDEHHWGTDYPVSSICLIKNSSLREVWNNRYEDVLSSRGTKISPSSDDVWIYVKSETFTIKDASGDTVARLESDGSFTTFGSVQDEIELLVGLDRADDGLNHLISLPKGEYTVQTPDDGAEIVTAFADDHQYVKVDASASSVTFRTLDAENQNLISLPSKDNGSFAVTLISDLQNAEGAEQTLINGTGEGADVSLGLAGTDWLLNNCKDVSVTVNDAPSDPETLFGKNINLLDVSLDDHEPFYYTGEAVCPAVVFSGNANLVQGQDYEVEYVNNVNATYTGSMASAVIRGKGDYTGEKTLFYDISYYEDGSVVRLPEGLKTVQDAAFAGTGIRLVYVPSTVSSLDLGTGAFPENVIFVFSPDSPLIEWAIEKGLHYKVQ